MAARPTEVPNGGLDRTIEQFPYKTVAASQTDSVLGANGAAGDFLDGVLVIPAAAACGVVTIKDGTTAIVSFPGGGTTAVKDLAPFYIPINTRSVNGAWKITTGASVSVLATGLFTE